MKVKLKIPLMLLFLMFSGCTKPVERELAPKEIIGKNCIVLLNRNHLGISSSDIISPDTHFYKGQSISVTGKIKNINSEWIILETDDSKNLNYIPTHSVLQIVTTK